MNTDGKPADAGRYVRPEWATKWPATVAATGRASMELYH